MSVSVMTVFHTNLDLRLPLRLEVVDVIYGEKYVTCELWYKQIDLEAMKALNINPF
jgi:hypothetical protein